MHVLAVHEWTARAAAHEARVDPWLQPHLERKRHGIAHPVEDFLFTYYSQRPAALRRWHPGYGVALEDAGDYQQAKGYAGDPVHVTIDHLNTELPLVRSIRALLGATAARQPQLACFGMHEWAMVYGLAPDDRRHPSWPLRLGSPGTDRVVASHRISCSHFDAYRFFTPAAAALNQLSPGRDDRVEFEQPGCLHAGMDLYKHAFRLSPLVESELVADCFELARDIRELDMRASPYDFSALGYEPVRVETTTGKQEYAAAQRVFAERGAPLRARLIEKCDRLLQLTRS